MKPRFYIIMGVSGCGKSAVGRVLAQRLGLAFYDADDFHPKINIEKMANGFPLTDEDRNPWLENLHNMISVNLKKNCSGVLACSALKHNYRERLLLNNPNVLIIYLKGSYELILARMSARTDHYMQPAMLKSQFDILEEPSDALMVDINHTVEEIVEMIIVNGNIE